MILSKPLTICALLGTYLYTNVNGAAYEIQMNGQTYQVNVVGQAGESYSDRTTISDDYGILMDDQKFAICSSLRMNEYCEQVTNNGAKTHNLFNYFPNHSEESIAAHANDKFNKNTSPYLMKQSMDDRTISYLSRQNIQSLGTKPTTPKHRNIASRANGASVGAVPINEIAQSLLDSAGIGGVGDVADLQHVTTRKFKYNKKNKNKNKASNGDQSDTEIATSEDIENLDDNEQGEVEVEFYSNLEGDTELANALGLDDDEFGETVDRIVAQLVASYLDNDSEEVDVGQIFANEISVDGNGDVSTEQINLDEGSMQEMGELLNNIAAKHKKMEIGDGEEGVNMNMNEEEEEHQAQLYQVRYVIDDDIDEDEQIQSEE